MNEQPPKLDYAAPTERPVSRPEIIVGYAFVTATLLVASIAVGFFALFALSYGQPNAPSERNVVTIGIGVVVVVLVALNWFAYRCYRNPDRRSVALGIWIGIGVAALIEGACFASFR